MFYIYIGQQKISCYKQIKNSFQPRFLTIILEMRAFPNLYHRLLWNPHSFSKILFSAICTGKTADVQGSLLRATCFTSSSVNLITISIQPSNSLSNFIQEATAKVQGRERDNTLTKNPREITIMMRSYLNYNFKRGKLSIFQKLNYLLPAYNHLNL